MMTHGVSGSQHRSFETHSKQESLWTCRSSYLSQSLSHFGGSAFGLTPFQVTILANQV